MGIFDRPQGSVPGTAAPARGTERAGPGPLPVTRGETTVSANVTLEGEIHAEDPVHIFGTVKGNIRCSRAVHVGPGARVEADIEAPVIHVMGSVQGNLVARERVHLGGAAQVIGDITTPRLVVEENAAIRGRVEMTEVPATAAPQPAKSARSAQDRGKSS